MAAIVKSAIFARDGVAVHDVSCAGSDLRSWSSLERSNSFGLVFVQQGAFLRRLNGVQAVLDPAVAYFEKPGQEQQIAHFPGKGDRCTSISFTPSFLASMWGGEVDVPESPVFIGPQAMLSHRLLRARNAEPIETIVHILRSVIAGIDPLRLGSRRPSTEAARKRIVDETREALCDDVNMSLIQLAKALAVSPHHLSRIFAELTGQTLSRYRIRLRVAHALHRLQEGDRDLTAIALQTGFSDHAHLTRSIHRELGHTPSALRSLLQEDEAAPR